MALTAEAPRRPRRVESRPGAATPPASAGPLRPGERQARHRLPLRHRERPLRAVPRSVPDLLVRVLRGPGRHPRAGAAGQVPAHLREARPRARRPRAGDRLRLGRLRLHAAERARREGDRRHDLARSSTRSRASACARPGSRTRHIRLRDYRTSRGGSPRSSRSRCSRRSGRRELPVFFGACDRLLAPGGFACIQTIAVPDQHFERFRRGTTGSRSTSSRRRSSRRWRRWSGP